MPAGTQAHLQQSTVPHRTTAERSSVAEAPKGAKPDHIVTIAWNRPGALTEAAEVDETPGQWHVVWTRSHCEQLVYDQLAAKGFHLFLPRTNLWSRRRGVRRLTRVPMFPGYLFLRHGLDKDSYAEVLKARGLVEVLGGRWDRLAGVPAVEVAAIEKLDRARVPAMPHPYLRHGHRVRIIDGPLMDVEGVLLRLNATKGVLVLSVNLLQRSVAVEVDCTRVAPV
jgi:transcription antitermination factor NusG